MRQRTRTPRLRVTAAPARDAGPCGACTKQCAGCVFAERAAEAQAEGDDAAVRRAMDQMARRGCRRLAVSARSTGGLRRRLATGAAAAALVLSLGLVGCETEGGGTTDTFGIDASEVFEVAILPADVIGGDTTPEVWVILPPECTTDADCDDPLYGCVDGACEQVMFPVMPECEADSDCQENEVCTNGACEPVVVSILPPACTTNDDCGLHELCVDGECQPAISILPACVTDQDCQPSEVCADGYCQPVVAVLPACVSDDDCNTPIEACIDGQCEQVMWPVMPQCLADDDCAVGEVCVNNTCQPVEPLPCAADADCPEGQVCEGECPSEDGQVMCILPVMGVCIDETNPVTCTSDADCVPGDVCAGGCPEGMFCILPMDGVCVTECSTDADCEVGETCVGAQACPPDQVCILPDQKGLCEPQMFAILPPSPLPVAPPAKTSANAWRAYVEGAIAWFRPSTTRPGRS